MDNYFTHMFNSQFVIIKQTYRINMKNLYVHDKKSFLSSKTQFLGHKKNIVKRRPNIVYSRLPNFLAKSELQNYFARKLISIKTKISLPNLKKLFYLPRIK